MQKQDVTKASMDKLKQPNLTQKQKQAAKQEQSYWNMMIDGIVRPPRANYKDTQLGNKYFTYNGKSFFRYEHQLMYQGKKIQLTLYLAENRNNFIILYMHGNSSCRVESLGLIKHIPKHLSLASFDFMGCGKNQQEDTITLGFREAQQAEFIANYLREQGFRIILWGRSMGAATALLYGKAEFIVADSSYKSFKSLCKQVAKQYSPAVVPNFMVACFFPCVFGKLRKDVDKKAKYDVEDLDVREALKNLDPNITIVFMSGKNDSLIHPRNSQKLYNACPCKNKYLKLFEGDHNSRRPEQTMIEVMDMISQYIVINRENSPMAISQIQFKIEEY